MAGPLAVLELVLRLERLQGGRDGPVDERIDRLRCHLPEGPGVVPEPRVQGDMAGHGYAGLGVRGAEVGPAGDVRGDAVPLGQERLRQEENEKD